MSWLEQFHTAQEAAEAWGTATAQASLGQQPEFRQYLVDRAGAWGSNNPAAHNPMQFPGPRWNQPQPLQPKKVQTPQGLSQPTQAQTASYVAEQQMEYDDTYAEDSGYLPPEQNAFFDALQPSTHVANPNLTLTAEEHYDRLTAGMYGLPDLDNPPELLPPQEWIQEPIEVNEQFRQQPGETKTDMAGFERQVIREPNSMNLGSTHSDDVNISEALQILSGPDPNAELSNEEIVEIFKQQHNLGEQFGEDLPLQNRTITGAGGGAIQTFNEWGRPVQDLAHEIARGHRFDEEAELREIREQHNDFLENPTVNINGEEKLVSDLISMMESATPIILLPNGGSLTSDELHEAMMRYQWTTTQSINGGTVEALITPAGLLPIDEWPENYSAITTPDGNLIELDAIQQSFDNLEMQLNEIEEQLTPSGFNAVDLGRMVASFPFYLASSPSMAVDAWNGLDPMTRRPSWRDPSGTGGGYWTETGDPMTNARALGYTGQAILSAFFPKGKAGSIVSQTATGAGIGSVFGALGGIGQQGTNFGSNMDFDEDGNIIYTDTTIPQMLGNQAQFIAPGTLLGGGMRGSMTALGNRGRPNQQIRAERVIDDIIDANSNAALRAIGINPDLNTTVRPYPGFVGPMPNQSTPRVIPRPKPSMMDPRRATIGQRNPDYITLAQAIDRQRNHRMRNNMQQMWRDRWKQKPQPRLGE